MTCANCGAENPDGKKFCLECGARLGAACAACGEARVGDAKFCGECGTPFAADGAATRGPSAQSIDAPVAERRLVSVLFADLVGFTPFAEESDSEDVREVLTRYFDLASDVIGRYGGTVEKFIGDAVMAVWGTPITQEDDAERSVRAALELVEAVKSLGPGIQARAGVLTGEAAVTLGATNQGMVAGDIVNTAARLQSVAQPGTVLVGESTMRAAAAAIAFEDGGSHELKGKAEPMLAWRAIRVVAERGGRGRSDALEAPFVGREDELRLLKDLFHATGREGRIRLVSIMGSAGIGKSRLSWEFSKYADGVTEPVWWHIGRSPAYGEGITFWALGEMIRRRAGLAADDDDATTRQRIGETVREHVPDDAERRWIEPALLALLGVGGESSGAEQLFAAWRTFFERMAATGTLALVFEDLHWADTGTLDFIDHLLEWSRSSPIFIVTLARPELLDRRPDWGAGKRNFTSLYLEPLGDDAMRQLLDGLVPGLPDEAVAAIVARADGIPLYAVETVRTLIAEKRLALDGNRYVPAGDLTSLAIPETLQALIAARLDGLPPDVRTLVTHAAVLGQSFTVAGMAAVTASSEEEVEPKAQDLVRRELLVHDVDSRSPERGQYAFVQGLIREVAYGMLARRDRRAIHLAAARHFETLDTDEVSGALAAHYVAAHENAAPGPGTDALGAQARIALKAAADRALALNGHAQAIAYLEQALAFTTDPGEQADLLEQAGRSASRITRHEEAEALFERAVALRRDTDDGVGLADALAGLGAVLLEARHLDRGRDMLERAAAEFTDLDRPGVAALHGQLARALGLLNDFAAALVASEPVLAAAEQQRLENVVADTMITKGMSLVSLGRMREGTALAMAARELARQNGLAPTELRATINLAISIGRSRPLEAMRLTRAALELTERMGTRDHLLAANAWEIAHLVGDWEWASGVLESSMAADPEGIDRVLLGYSMITHQALRGEDATDLRADVDRSASGSADSYLGIYVRGLSADLNFVEGDLNLAREQLESQAATDPLNAATVLSNAGRAATWTRDLASLERIHAHFTRVPDVGDYVDTLRRMQAAGIAALRGNLDDAHARYRQVIRELDELGVVVDIALVAIDMAAVIGPEDPEVRARVDEAREVFERLGARAYLRRLDAVLDARSPSRPAAVASTAIAEVESRG
ncbi:MAG: adenylate/guanylate cyclase domain-containing protein [Candidatus Limnocylindria bacterium]